MDKHRKTQSDTLKDINASATKNKKLQTECEKAWHTHHDNILASMPHPVYWIDKNCMLLGGNHHLANMLGLKSHAELVGLDYERMATLAGWTEAQSKAFKTTALKIFSAGAARCNIDEPSVVIKSKTRYYLSSQAPLCDSIGEVVGVVGILTDITEQKKAEATLKIAQEKTEVTTLSNTHHECTLNNIIANLPGHVYWKDKNGVYLGCNDRQARSLGLISGLQIIGKTDFDLNWPNEAGEAIRKNDINIITSGKTETFEEIAQVDGKEAIVLSQKTPLKDSAGNIIGILGVSIDFTKTKQENFYLQDVINKIPGSIYWKDKDGKYLGCNDFVRHMAGTNHIIGKTDFDMPWKEYAQQIKHVDQQIIETNLPLELEEHPTLANDKQVIMLTRKTPLKNEKGNIVGIIGISVDITERKKLEAALKEAKEKAEAANKAKTEFLENMRHDIRTPLVGITGFANIIADEVSDPKIKEYVDNLAASSHALLDLLNEILEVIKVNSGDVPLLKKKFDLKKRLYDVINLNQAKARHKRLDLIFDYDNSIPPYVIGDCTRVHRIALELVTNALNFTNKGYVKLTTQLAKNAERELVIKLIIEDTGIGIAPDKQQEIFLQFKRLTPSYQGIYKGAGLGLAIVKQFLDEIEGEIYVESQVGVGTKFYCLIPLKKPLLDDEFGCEDIEPTKITQVSHAIPKIPALSKTSKIDAGSTRHRILIVEDQTIASMVAKNILTHLHCDIDVASDGKTAIQLAQETNYDLIFMDIGLPDIDGYEVTKRIRLYELNKGTHIPIIALTAHVDEENKQRCIEVGMNAVLSKPLGKEKAEDILNAFIPYRKKLQKNECKAESKQETELFRLSGKVVDIELAKNQLEGKEELVYEMLTILENSLPEELRQLNAAHDKKDWTKIQAIAHKLKGGAYYTGTERLREACSQLEISIKTEKKETFSALYDQMINEINAVEEVLKSKNY